MVFLQFEYGPLLRMDVTLSLPKRNRNESNPYVNRVGELSKDIGGLSPLTTEIQTVLDESRTNSCDSVTQHEADDRNRIVSVE